VSIGASIFLIAFGAILAFAVDAEPDWLRINVVGWVLIVTGITMLVLTFTIWSKRRRGTTVTQHQVFEDGKQTSSERKVYQDTTAPPPE
jgi:heme/copper-type cytochrome/quinol oxidase subunit 2